MIAEIDGGAGQAADPALAGLPPPPPPFSAFMEKTLADVAKGFGLKPEDDGWPKPPPGYKVLNKLLGPNGEKMIRYGPDL